VTGSDGEPAGARLQPEEVTARSGSNFLAGFACLPPARRAGMTAIYAFCRVADDAVDEAPDAATGERHLAFWRDELAAAAGSRAVTPVGRAVQAAMQRFGVPAALLGDLLDGVATDLVPRPFADEPELHRYCYRVAAAVGLACLPVLGAVSDGARTFADALGHALQRTNILRDVAADARTGRCYLPQTWLAATGVDAAWLRGDGPANVYSPDGPVAKLCARCGDAARAEFARARTALCSLVRAERRALVPARIMGAVYGDLLSRLQRRSGDLRSPRVRVPRGRKFVLALQVFAGVRA
jgi:phytoene/squalene synthetase